MVDQSTAPSSSPAAPAPTGSPDGGQRGRRRNYRSRSRSNPASATSETPIVAAHISKDSLKVTTADEQAGNRRPARGSRTSSVGSENGTGRSSYADRSATAPHRGLPNRRRRVEKQSLSDYSQGSFNAGEDRLSVVGNNDQPAAKLGPAGETLRIIPLGGVEEIGKNMTALEWGDDIIIIDCGFMFPDQSMPGVDYIIPDVTYLAERKSKIRGMVITHAHMDHIGAFPYVYEKLGTPPIHSAPITLAFIKKKLEEFGIDQKARMIPFNPDRDKLRLGRFEIDVFRLTHSAPDSVGVAVKTPHGHIVYTTDWKFDHTPADGKRADFATLARLGEEGVLALFSDSTNIDKPGTSISEAEVGHALKEAVGNCRGRIILATMSSLITRIQQVLQAAEKHGRKVAFVGRSMVDNVDMAIQLGNIMPPKNTIIDINDIGRYSDDQVLIVTTGSQGEELSGLTRIAQGEHRQVKIKRGDTVILSASAIPGNEKAIQQMMDGLAREGARVVNNKMMSIHTSGHANREDLKLMIALTKPQYFLPIHGERFKLIMHGELAVEMGVKPENILIGDNGQVTEFKNGQGAVTTQRVPAGYVLVDGLGIGDVGNIVLRDRKMMAQDGIFVSIITVDHQTGKVLASPDIISRGFVYMRDNEDLIGKTRDEIKRILEEQTKKTPFEWSWVKNELRDGLERFLFEQTHRRPMVIPVVIEV